MSNPFNDLIDMFREEGKHYNEPSFYFASVTSKYPNLKVKFNDVEFSKSQLLIDKLLLDKISLDPNYLNIGDRVVLITDSDKFIIMSKVVSI